MFKCFKYDYKKAYLQKYNIYQNKKLFQQLFTKT
ncbi:hypothetical protein EDD80_102229 [Anseongella ginsenosidimutans]|uniref:Uncharacterized protein n=1 Tax=Anseongella ginsenosidimutans TaxID=496056 RepID=A0A4R3KUF5_9SPHI|nr:hypothetical protein EDD80_102229 [Anseongella ginsenosidimutans]